MKNLLTASTLGTPPLVISSRNGHLECCKYLVEKGADLELAGSVTFDGENIGRTINCTLMFSSNVNFMMFRRSATAMVCLCSGKL